MAKTKTHAGNCGYVTTVDATKIEGYRIGLKIETDCPHIQKMIPDLIEVDAINEISPKRGTPLILQKGLEYCTHAACPVPVGIIKAVEVEAGLALPQDATITFED